jgi:cell division septal protein FtsQ
VQETFLRLERSFLARTAKKKKKKKKGSGKISRREHLKRTLVVGVRSVLAISVIVCLAYAIYVVRYSSLRSSLFSIQDIQFEGTQRLERDQLASLIRSTFLDNVLAIELDRLRALVESEKWVKEATVRRKLPGKLTVYVREREPIAVARIEGQLYAVDQDGVILAPFGPDFKEIDSPIVNGLRNLAVEDASEENNSKMALYSRVLEDLDSTGRGYSRSISEVYVASLDRIEIVPQEEPVPVNLGSSHFLERYQAYLTGLDYIRDVKDQYGVIESIDATFPNKLIVHTPQGEQTSARGPGE